MERTWRFESLMVAGMVFLASFHCQAQSVKQFADGVRRSDNLTLLEGLPHQWFESRALERERRTKSVRNLHGYTFYSEPLDISTEDARQLATGFGNPEKLGHISDPRLQKKCGGFHPDYALEWQQGENRYQALVCFGCAEVKIFGSNFIVEYDFSEEVKATLAVILRKYRKNRPNVDRTIDARPTATLPAEKPR